MWNSYDLNQVDDLFWQDERVPYFSSEKKGAIIGFDAVRKNHRGFGFIEGGKETSTELWMEDLHSSVFGKMILVTGIWFFKRADGSVLRGQVTIVYLKRGEEHCIAHMHFANYPGKK